jgi:hypothetical protein
VASAEFALLIRDHELDAGIGTLLIEHSPALPGKMVFRRFGADVLTENYPLIKMVHQLDFPTTTLSEGGTIVMSFPAGNSGRACGGG